MREIGHEEILEKLGQPTGRNYHCPAHEDSKPSLAVTHTDDDKTLFYCFSGCSFSDICYALDIEPKNCFPQEGKVWGKRLWDVYEYY